MKNMKKMLCLAFVLSLSGSLALAKLPAPSDEAKAKAAEAAAKTAWNGKVDAYLLCKSQDKVATHFYQSVKVSGKDAKPPVAMPACTDPGPFVYTPPEAVVAPAAAAPVAPVLVADPAKKS